MRIEIKIDETCAEPKVLILTDRITDEVNDLFRKLSETQPQAIAGFRGDQCAILEPDAVIRFYGANQKVYAQTKEGEYTVRMRLYELAERLEPRAFVRISNSEIINMKKVVNLDLRLTGTIVVRLIDGETSYVSRRYVTKIKRYLGI